jgi:uncharacterized protein (TIGR02118 family)
MIIVTVLYPGGEGKTFDMDYYLKIHIALVQTSCGDALKAVAIDKGLSGPLPGSAAPYAVICRLSFESVETFMGVMMKNASEIMGDIPNFTNVSPTIQISDAVR